MRASSVVLLAALAAASCLAHADWPQFQGPNRNGISSEKGLARSWSPGGPKVLWTAKLSSGYGGPSIHTGKVYLLDRDGGKADVLRCWDLATGLELRHYSHPAPGKVGRPGSRSQPTVDDRYIFAIGPFGQFYCFDKTSKDRKPIWTKNLLKEYGSRRPGWGFTQAPVLYRNLVIVAPQAARPAWWPTTRQVARKSGRARRWARQSTPPPW